MLQITEYNVSLKQGLEPKFLANLKSGVLIPIKLI